MENNQKSPVAIIVIIIIIILLIGAGIYFYEKNSQSSGSGAPTATSTPNLSTPVATIDPASLVTTETRPTISGTTNATSLEVAIVDSTGKILYGNGTVSAQTGPGVQIQNGKWQVTVSGPSALPFGVYTVNVYDTGSNLLATGQLQVNSASISISGMSQYTDATFGFSFWYLAGWTVTEVAVPKTNKYPGGNVVKELDVATGHGLITLEEFTSPTLSITDSTGVGACPVCVPVKYYFDTTTHTWMVIYPNGNSSGSAPSGVAELANISSNTMGGLHMLAGSQRFGANTIIPLSASNFVIVTVGGEIATGSMNPQALAKTIVALDPSVATPVSQAEQINVVQDEKTAYAGL